MKLVDRKAQNKMKKNENWAKPVSGDTELIKTKNKIHKIDDIKDQQFVFIISPIVYYSNNPLGSFIDFGSSGLASPSGKAVWTLLSLETMFLDFEEASSITLLAS